MTTISLMTTDQFLSVVEQPELASGDQNSVRMRVDVDSLWGGYTISAVFFTDSEETVYEQILVDGECIIPHEVLAKAGLLYIGIRGVDTDTDRIKTSALVKYKIVEGAPIGDASTVPPTADVYQQLLKISNDTKDIAQGVRDDFDAGAIPALQEQNKKEGFKFWVGKKAEYDKQKDALNDNVFCIITDDTSEEEIWDAINRKAPAGYGLGGAVAKDWSEVDSLTSPGWYKFATDKGISIGGYDHNYAYMRVDSYNEVHVCQTLHLVNIVKITAIRWRHDRVWGEWEFDNPPMKVGVEYRTTERFMEKPVYTKLIDCGNSENGKTVKFTGVDRVIRYVGYVDRFTLPHMWGTSEKDPYFANVCVTNTEATFLIGESLLGRKTYLQIWYVK